jgi:lysine 2,3-aminomutase
MTMEPARHAYAYSRIELVEPDWRRLPGFREATAEQWRDAQWQRAHCVRGVRQLQEVFGSLVDDAFYADLAADAERFATMPILIPPQMLNTMCPQQVTTDALVADPIRRYMLPIASDRDSVQPSHPHATRDSLHEAQMWAVEGLTHRYPYKVLAELVTTCPQYCGHCTRMDLVGTSTPQVAKARFTIKPEARHNLMLDYLKRTPSVRDVVVSGGDVANVPWRRLEAFLLDLLALDSIRDIRLASKALAGLPQHWLQAQVLAGLERVARIAADRGVHLAVHTHVNHVQSVTPLVASAARAVLATGVRDVRNQGVLLNGVNATAGDLLDLCFALHGEAGIVPYYFYLCDIVPNVEHWRTPVHEAARLQEALMGLLPGYATPRIVCDVPHLGKRWVHQYTEYDRERGISYWDGHHPYYDPISSLPATGRAWWAAQTKEDSHVQV